MGMDVGIYIQKRTHEGWKNVSLYHSDNTKVVLWRCGYDTADYFRECGSMYVDIKDLRELAFQENWIERTSDMLPSWHVMTYSKVKYLANFLGNCNETDTIEESFDKVRFWEDLRNEIYMYLSFAGYEYTNSDDIRIIAFESC